MATKRTVQCSLFFDRNENRRVRWSDCLESWFRVRLRRGGLHVDTGGEVIMSVWKQRCDNPCRYALWDRNQKLNLWSSSRHYYDRPEAKIEFEDKIRSEPGLQSVEMMYAN